MALKSHSSCDAVSGILPAPWSLSTSPTAVYSLLYAVVHYKLLSHNLNIQEMSKVGSQIQTPLNCTSWIKMHKISETAVQGQIHPFSVSSNSQ